MEKNYMISDASKLVEVENHVLRYWEEELELKIPRNEMGHRYYRESDIQKLRRIKELKEQGFQLKAIKKVLPDLGKLDQLDPMALYKLREELNAQVAREAAGGLVEKNVTHSKGAVIPLHQNYPKKEDTPTDRLQQFEIMLRQMIYGIMQEMSRESEERICNEVTTRLQKEMNYLLMRKEELHEKQVALLHQILNQIQSEGLDGAKKSLTSGKETSAGADAEAAATEETVGEYKHRRRVRRKKKKLFAKSE